MKAFVVVTIQFITCSNMCVALVRAEYVRYMIYVLSEAVDCGYMVGGKIYD